MHSTIAAAWRVRVGVSLLLLLGVAGCGAGLYPVRGKVTFEDGTPVISGLVVFERTEGDKTIMARGALSPDGSFSLSSSRPGDGVSAGKYRVLVTVPEAWDEEEAKRRGPAFDKRYMDFKTSGLEFEVQPGANEYPIQVTRAGQRPR
jgi:hypothetical protein